MSEFKAMKFWIGDDPELSEKVQKTLFDAGYKWCFGMGEFRNQGSPALYTELNGNIFCGTTKGFFDRDSNEEINIDWMRTNKPETIDLAGKTYIKSELEEALRNIKPVD